MSEGGKRLVSLDAFRGATMALMVLVNNAGDGQTTYAPLEHAEWHGWTPTDVVFPSFLWIVGVAMTLSMAKRVESGASRIDLFRQVARRAAILFVLGLAVYAFPDFSLSHQRIPGVLQRIAICYLIAAAIYLTTSWRAQVAWVVGLLAVYWALMAFVPVPGYGAGRLDVEGNLAHYVDRVVLGAHNYAATKTWDPEGIVSTIPAIATALLGVLTGTLLRLDRPLSGKIRWMLIIGAVMIALALVINPWLPINKKLWTSSFTLFMAGLDSALLAGFIWIVDVLGFRKPVQPFVILGMNAITIYMLSEGLSELLDGMGWHRPIYQALFLRVASPYNASLLYALAFTGLMFLAAWLMYRRGWFVRI